VIGDDVGSACKPECGELCQHLTLAGDKAEDAIESGEAVGCNQDQLVFGSYRMPVYLTNLAVANRSKKGKVNAG
jgi:hypothetical protein